MRPFGLRCFDLKFFLFRILFPSLTVLDFAKLYAIMWYNCCISFKFKIPSLSPTYFVLSSASNMCFAAASHPNMRKNGEIPEDSVGKKLYADVAFHTKSSHSNPFCICLPTVVLRNLWNPLILPLH